MNEELKQLKAKLEEKVDPVFRAYLLQEIPKGESLLTQAAPNSPEWKAVLGPLSKMYLVLNQQLGLMCQHLGYPLQQWKWNESQPLETLAEVFQGIEATQWYQRHLAMMLTPPEKAHPWTTVLT